MSETTERDAVSAKIEMLKAKVDWLRHRAERAERILAALREPSDGVVEAVFAAMLRMDTKTTDIIRAAVAAAEKEVGG